MERDVLHRNKRKEDPLLQMYKVSSTEVDKRGSKSVVCLPYIVKHINVPNFKLI